MDPLERVRVAVAGLPEVEERVSHGEPAWFIRRGKLFAMFADRHHDDRVAVWCAAPSGAQEMLIATAPERFFRPPYVGPRGWVGVYLDRPITDDELTGILLEAWQVVAPAKLRSQLAGES